MKNLKYPIYLFVAILVAKFGYVVVESFYNYYVLTTTTSANITQKTLKNLNENGHLISAFGLTALLVPLYYLLVKKQKDEVVYTTLALSSIVTFFLMYSLLNVAVDKIVESNKDQRYNAFYITLFKYGLLDNRFVYNSFIENKKIVNNKLDVNDKILLTNTFLLLHADQKLIDKLRQRGKNIVADMYIQKYAQDDYNQKYEAYKQTTLQMTNLWKEFNQAREKLNTDIKKLEDKKTVKKAYKKLISSLKRNYKNYKNGWTEVENTIKKETSSTNVSNTREKLSKYFRYKRHNKAKKQYEDTMYKNFGHYIEPSVWLDSNNNLTNYQIKKVIIDEIMKKAKPKLKGLPKGLSSREFANHIDVKSEVSQKLKKQGILIPYDFDYKYSSFEKYYMITINKKINQIPKIFYSKLEKKIGKNDLKLSMGWENFLHSGYIRKQIESKLSIHNKKDVDTIIKVIDTKDLANFKKMIYLPKVVDKIEAEYEYSKEDFLDGHIASKKGDEAVKMLYIPPFALTVSILAILLNLVTILGMLLQYGTKLSSKSILIAKAIFVAMILLTPTLSKYDGFDNKLIEKVSNNDIKTYLKFLNWISYYESINSNLHK